MVKHYQVTRCGSENTAMMFLCWTLSSITVPSSLDAFLLVFVPPFYRHNTADKNKKKKYRKAAKIITGPWNYPRIIFGWKNIDIPNPKPALTLAWLKTTSVFQVSSCAWPARGSQLQTCVTFPQHIMLTSLTCTLLEQWTAKLLNTF